MVAGVIAFFLFLALLILVFLFSSIWPLNNFLWTHDWQQYYAIGALILFLGLPFFGFLIWLIRRILGIRSQSGLLRWTFGLLWMVGWVLVILLIASISRDVKFYEHAPAVAIPISTQPPEGRLLVTVSQPPLTADSHRYWWLDEASEGWDLSEDELKLSFVKFKVTPSKDNLFRVSIEKSSAGNTAREAIARAKQIEYRATYSDGMLDLGNAFVIYPNSKYRGQMITIDIKVPIGKKIRFDKSIKDKLNPVNFQIERGNGWRNRRIIINMDIENGIPWQTDVDYTISRDGELRTFAPSP